MIASYTYTRNCIKIDYPFVESLQSALLVADRVFICDCDSTDGTYEILQAIASCDTRIELMRHPWGDHYSIQGRICNGMLERIEAEGYDYAFQIQADEIVCEWTARGFRESLAGNLCRPRYVHLSPDYRTSFPFIYERKAVISKCSAKLRYDGDSDGCAIAGEATDIPLTLMHVGKVEKGREAAALAKELSFQKLYAALGCFPDPKFVAQESTGVVDYRKAMPETVFTPYAGPWPAALLPRMAKAEGRLS